MNDSARPHKVVVVVHGPFDDSVPDVGLLAWSVHRPHPAEAAAQPDDVSGLVMAWCAPDGRLEPTRWFDVPITAYLVDERVQIEWPDVPAPGVATPAIEQCSFVRRRPELTRDGFAAHWSERHAPLVPVHHPGVARYVQNVVIEGLTPAAPEVDGIAQLYFRTAHDLHERFYDSDDGKRIVGEDVAKFIDRPRGWRITAQETWLRT